MNNLIIQGCAIVSGMALGIDTMAHQSALQNGGYTIAVWGSGLDQPYPPQNAQLAEQIIEQGGAIVSQFPLGTKANTYTFPERNKIIAGLSQATVVIEANLDSGALLTAKAAFRYQRPVLAVPGSIFSNGSQGTHQLIQQGGSLGR